MSASPPANPLLAQARWRLPETIFWIVCLAAVFVFPSRALLFTEIAILGLFALSLDLLLGYSGIVSLGHAAFYGLGAYAAGVLAKYGYGNHLLGLAAAALASASLGFATSFLVLRGSDLTRLMVTLGIASMLYELANKQAWITGGADGLNGIPPTPLLGLFEFDFAGRMAYLYSLSVLFVLRMCSLRVALTISALADSTAHRILPA